MLRPRPPRPWKCAVGRTACGMWMGVPGKRNDGSSRCWEAATNGRPPGPSKEDSKGEGTTRAPLAGEPRFSRIGLFCTGRRRASGAGIFKHNGRKLLCGAEAARGFMPVCPCWSAGVIGWLCPLLPGYAIAWGCGWRGPRTWRTICMLFSGSPTRPSGDGALER